MNFDLNNGLNRPLIGGMGRALLYGHFQTNINRGVGALETQSAQHSCRKATISTQTENKNPNGSDEIIHNICDGVTYTYVITSSGDAGLDFLAAHIKTKDLNTVRIVVVCQFANEAVNLMKELGKRSIGCLLVREDSKAVDASVLLWNEGQLNSVLAVCDAMLKHLSESNNLKINCLVHYGQTLPHVFQNRIQLLIPHPVKDTQVLMIRFKADNELKLETYANASVTPDDPSAPATLGVLTIQDPPATPVVARATPVPPVAPGAPAAQGVTTKSATITDFLSNYILSLQNCTVQRTNETANEKQINKAREKIYTYNCFGIFAWSRIEQFSCYNANDVLFHQNIRDGMLLNSIGEVRAKSVQRFAWPHVTSGHSMFVIGNKFIGKTWSYLPTLCQRVIVETPTRLLNLKDCGPIGIILCANIQEGEQIANWCMAMLNTSHMFTKKVVKALNRNSIGEAAQSLKNPCGVLITTVECLMQLYLLHSSTFSIFNPASLKCVAFDGIERIWRAGRMYCEKLIKWFLKVLKFERGHSQMFVVGRLWIDLFMRPLISNLPDVLLIFGDALEASVYAGLNFEMIVPSENQYEQDILQILINRKNQRVVLACSGNADAVNLSKLLHAKSINNLVIEQMYSTSDLTFNPWGNERLPRVVIVSDDLIPKFRGANIDCLVHYGYSTWPRFKSRFSIFYGDYENLSNKSLATSVIVVRPSSFEQTWLICDFMLKHERYPPESYLTLLTDSRMQDKSEFRLSMQLCRQMLYYGNCIRHSCQYRHCLWRFETEPAEDIPTKGQIKFLVLSSVTPAQAAVKLIERQPKKYYLNMPITNFGKRLQLHYEQANHHNHENPQIGDVCVLKIKNLYQRVSITRLDTPNRIEVKQVDVGIEYHIVDKSELLVCDKKFKDEPFEALNLCVTGLMPFNMERVWPDDAKKLVRHRFFNLQNQLGRVFTAEVDFAFHKTVFVENIYDPNGNDLKSFVRNQIPMYMDGDVKMRIQKCISAAKRE